MSVALLVIWVDLMVEHNPAGNDPSPHCVNNVPPQWLEVIPLRSNSMAQTRNVDYMDHGAARLRTTIEGNCAKL